jgi:Putative peptidoglycan binding domain
MKIPLLAFCLTAIGLFALSPASRGAPPGAGGGSFHGGGGGFHGGGGGFHDGGFHGGFAGHSSGRASRMEGHSVTVPHFSRVPGFARGLGSHNAPLRAGHGNDIAFWRHDDGRFRDHDIGRHGHFRDNDDRFFRHHRHFFNDFDFVAFGFPYWWYPDYGYVDNGYSDEYAYNDSAPVYDDQYWQDLAMKVQSELSRRGYYDGPIDGVIGADSSRAIRAFQEAQGLPATGRIDPNVLRALKLPLPQVSLRSN